MAVRRPDPSLRSAPRTTARLVGAVMATIVAGPSLPAHAHALPPITWEAPAGCPEAERVEAHVRTVVGARATSDAVTAVHARVAPHDGAWLLTVGFTGRDGTTERRLTLSDCEATVNATALLVAIALVGAPPTETIAEPPTSVPVPDRPEPASIPRASETPPAPQPTSATPPASHPGLARPTAREPPREIPPRKTPRALIQLGPAMSVGVLPHVAPGLLAAIGAAWPRLRVTLGYARWFRSPARAASNASIGADLSLHAGNLRVGPVRRVGPIELHAGIGLEFGAMRVVGVGAAVTYDRRTWWGATLVGGALAWAPRALRGRGAVLVQADLVVPLHRPNLILEAEPANIPIFQLGPLGLRAALQLEARLF